MTEVNKKVNDQNQESVEQVDPYKAQADEISRMLKEGATIQEALVKTQHLVPSNRIENRVEYIKGLQDIASVKKALHGAHAKKSKARKAGNKEAVERYEAEVEAAKTRYNDLMSQISKSDNPLKAALELGEEPAGLVQIIVIDEEAKAKKKLEQVKETLKWTNKGLKAELNKQPVETPEWFIKRLQDISKELVEIYEGRAKGNDQRVITLNRRLHLIDQMAKKAQEAKNKQEEEAKAKKEQEAKTKKEEPKKEQGQSNKK